MDEQGGVFVQRAQTVQASPVSPRSNVMPAAEIYIVKGKNVEDLEMTLARRNVEINDLHAEIDRLHDRIRELEAMLEAAR